MVRRLFVMEPDYPEGVVRPRTRGECAEGERPCPWVSCSHHLYLDVRPSGSLQLNFPDLDPDQLKETCSLDVADRGGESTLDEIGALMNVTRERIRQIEAKASAKVLRAKDLREHAGAPDLGQSDFVRWVLARRRPARLDDVPDDLFA